MIVLRIEEPDRAPRVVPVAVLGRALGIGRAPDNAVRLADPRVSAHHCALRRRPDGYEIADSGSSNGVRLDGRRIEGAAPLVAGARIELGATTITVESVSQKSAAGQQTLEFDLAAVTRRLQEDVGPRRDARQRPADPVGATVVIDSPELRWGTQITPAAVRRGSSPRRAAPAPPTRTRSLVGLDGTLDLDDRPARGRASLRRLDGADAQRTWLLDYGQVLIGRAVTCDIVFDDRSISREHARITVEPAGVFIEDVSGQRRTRVNNRRFEGRRRLVDGDLIRISRVVLEFSGGWTDETGEIASIVSRFVVGEQVFEQPTLSIGADRRCDVVLDDDSIEPEHLRIERLADGQFRVTDRSTHGLRLDGRRVSGGVLRDGARVGFGHMGLRVSIAGTVCHLDLIEPTAPSLEAVRAVTGPIAPSDGAVEAAPATRRAAIWTPPGDVQTRPWDRRLLVAGLAAAVAGVLVFLVTRGDDGLLDQRVSPAHAGAAFLAASGGAECAGCHTHAGASVSDASCVGCHRDPRPRHAHLARAGAEPGASAALGCLDCHAEHPEAAGGRFPTPTARCADAGCHPTRHRALTEAKPGPLPFDAAQRDRLRAAAPAIEQIGAERFLAMRRPAGVAALHRIHGGIERRCIGCHAGDGGAIDATESCMRCHASERHLTDLHPLAGPDPLAGADCRRCHSEHGAPPGGPRTPAIAGDGGDFGLGPAVGLSLVLLALGLVSRRWSDPGAHPATQPEPSPPDPKLDIHIFRSLCVGSKACVDACPYRVLELVETVVEREGEQITERFATVANFESCNECGICVDVCVPRALVRVAPGAPIPGLERADIDANYMTTVPGLYLIGQAAGVSFVRNAINLGARTVHHIRHGGLIPGAAARAGWQTDIAIVGAGPAGLSAAMTAAEVGLRAVVFERGAAFAPNIRAFHKGKKVQHQPASVAALGSLWMRDCTREELLDAWTRQLAVVDLDLRFGHTVVGVEPVRGAGGAPGFSVSVTRASAGGPPGTLRITAARVVLAPGGGDPRRLDIPGASLPKVMTACVDPAAHVGARICVYGGGNSALEVAAACAEAGGGRNEVRLVYRKAKFSRASARNRQRVESLVAAGRITLHLETVLVRVDEASIELEGPGAVRTAWPNTHVYTMLGYEGPERWLRSLGVSFSEQPRDWSPAASDDLRFMREVEG